MNDWIVPNFSARVKAGEVFFNPMSIFEQIVHPTEGTGTLRYLHNQIACSGLPTSHQKVYEQGPNCHVDILGTVFTPSGPSNIVGCPSLFSGYELEQMCVEASTKCFNERGRSDGNIWETVAEYGKTRAMLPSLARNLNNFVEHLARTPHKDKVSGRVMSVLRAARESGNAYLLYRYGLAPLVKETQNVLLALNGLEGRFRMTARGAVEDKRITSSTTVGSAFSYEYRVQTNWTQVLKVRAMSLDEYAIDKLWAAGASYKGLVTLPWELVPYSFVVDWFVNIGEFIGAMVPTPNLQQLGCALTYEYLTEGNAFIASYSPKGIAVIQSAPSGSKLFTARTKTRIPSLSQPRVVVRVPNPFYRRGDEFNLKRAADALALTAQRLISGR